MKILQLETGIRCNNRCVFCYQRDYRESGRAPKEPTQDELLRRLEWGRMEGYDGVGFSGGEPTIREDFPALVAKANDLGYERISLTTNGLRLSDPEYRRSLLLAGLNGIGWSVHGVHEETHDALTAHPGAFRTLLSAVKGVTSDARRMGLRVDQNTFSVVTRRNADELPDMARRFSAIGVRLAILQPLSFSRGNLAAMADLALPLDQVVAAVNKVIHAAQDDDFRVKPFNLPPCLFHENPIEREMHKLRIFRRHERWIGESRLPTPSGFFRATACENCAIREPCPGLPVSLLPQAALRDALLPSARSSSDERWLAGLELARKDTLCDLVRAARSHGARRVVLFLGGDSVLGDNLFEALVAARPDAVRFVVHRREPRSGDLRRATRGNVEDVERCLRSLSSTPGAERITREVGVLLERSERAEQERELAQLVEAGAQRVHLEVAPRDSELPVRLRDALRLVMGPLRPRPWARKAELVLDLPEDPNAIPAWQRKSARDVVRVEDVRGRLRHTAPTGPSFGWVTDSVPIVATPAQHRESWAWPAEARGPLVAELAGLCPVLARERG